MIFIKTWRRYDYKNHKPIDYKGVFPFWYSSYLYQKNYLYKLKSYPSSSVGQSTRLLSAVSGVRIPFGVPKVLTTSHCKLGGHDGVNQ